MVVGLGSGFGIDFVGTSCFARYLLHVYKVPSRTPNEAVMVMCQGASYRIFAMLMHHHLVLYLEKFSLSCPGSPIWRDRSVWVVNSHELVSLVS